METQVTGHKLCPRTIESIINKKNKNPIKSLISKQAQQGRHRNFNDAFEVGIMNRQKNELSKRLKRHEIKKIKKKKDR
jgi:hypothetical protein